MKEKLFQLPYMGVPTFLHSELNRNRANQNADISFVGVPYDTGASNLTGARYGPRAFREASMMYAYLQDGNPLDGVFDSEKQSTLIDHLQIVDSDDVIISPENRQTSEEIITKEISKLLRCNSFPLVVGGDHSITYSIVRAYDEQFNIIQFDAHVDFMDESYLNSCAHGTSMRRANKLKQVGKIIHCGIRGLLNSREGLKASINSGNIIITAKELLEKGIIPLMAHLSRHEKYYITFDADFLDPSIAPATGTPEPGGINYRLASKLLKYIASNHDVIGIDFTELNPLYDIGNITAQHIVRLSLDFLGSWRK